MVSNVLMRGTSPRFSSKAFVDLGASHPGGTVKIQFVDKNGKAVGTPQRVLLHPDKYAQNSPAFVTRVAQEIQKQFPKSLHDAADWLTDTVVFCPGQAENNVLGIAINIKNQQGQSLCDINFDVLSNQLGSISDGKKVKVLAANDMFGVGSAAIAALKASPEHKAFLQQPIMSASVIMTGGGCGVIGLQKIGPQIYLTGMEAGHTPTGHGKQVLETSSASVPALTRLFAKSLRLSKKDAGKLVDLGIGRVVTQHKIVPSNNEEEALIKASGLFVAHKEEEKTVYKLKKVNSESHNLAAQAAILTYLNDLGRFIAGEAAASKHAVIVTGPLAQGISDWLETKGSTLRSELMRYVDQYLDPSARNLADKNEFRIITDLSLADNTAGGNVFSHAQNVGRFNWFAIPASAI